MWTEKMKVMALGASTVMLVACGTPSYNTSSTAGSAPATSNASVASGYGVVESIDMVPREQAGVGLGTVAGAVVGGLLGNQVGGGSGRTAATVAGVAGGAAVGHRMQQNSRAADADVYRIAVRMENGAVHTVVQETAPNVRIGEQVRLDNGVIVERLR